MTGMRKFWISIIWGGLLIGALIFITVMHQLTDGIFIAWLSGFGGVFVFFITGNVVGDHIVDSVTNALGATQTPAAKQ